jgi:hypothetical protein
VRGARAWNCEADFFAATHAPSTRYSPAKVREGRYCFFVEREQAVPLPGVRSRPKASEAASAASASGLVFSDFLETGEANEAREAAGRGFGAMRGPRGGAGLSSRAEADLKHLAWTLRPMQERLSFWTVTLPTSALRALEAIPGGWEAFSRWLHKELTRQLKKAGLIPWWLSVTEVQPQRSFREGFICPHLHIAFVGRRSRKRNRKTGKMARGGWLLTPQALDGIIAGALRAVTGRDDFPLGAAGQVVQVKYDVASYLGKYMSKGSEDAERWNNPATAKGLHISRWWHRSNALHIRGKAHQPVLHGHFGWFLLGYSHWVEALGLVKVREVEPDQFRPGGVAVEGLRSDGLRIAWDIWRDGNPEFTGQPNVYFPAALHHSLWGDYRMKCGNPRLSRRVTVDNCRDVVSLGVSSIPSGYLETNDRSFEMGERISSPVTDVIKERLEHLYREIDVPEPVLPSTGGLGGKAQLEFPIELGLTGSAWDLGPAESWDPYWDDPNWRGGPLRGVTG